MVAIAREYQETGLDLLNGFALRGSSKPVRTIREFALDEIILPDDGGPFSGEKFNLECQPYVDLLYEELESGNWSEVFITGPSQSGKTLCAFVIIVLYIVAELRKNVIVGVPIGDIVNDKWEIDIAPVFRASASLAKLLPTKGPGSLNGKVRDSVVLTNGVTIKFMTKGGSDASKAAFTAPKVVVTEAAAWSESVGTSKEADPLSQLRGRQRSKSRFDENFEIDSDRQMIVEGTVTDAESLPWRMKKQSSDSKLVAPCVHCRDYVSPERQDFGGFDKAKNEFEAARSGCFFCPSCGESINQEQRETMIRSMKLLHRGQKISKTGKVRGPKPKTSVLWFRWSAFHNLFLKIADLAADEWKAKQLEEGAEQDNAERELCHQVWAIPTEIKHTDAPPLSREAIRNRQERFTIGTVPPNTQHLVFGVDVGRWRCWYFGIALRSDGTLHCPIYGAHDTSLARGLTEQQLKEYEPNAIKSCLHQIFDILEAGFAMPGGDLVKSDLTLVDTRYATKAVFEVIKSRGTGLKGPYIGIQGLGKAQLDSRKYVPPKSRNKTVRKIGDRYHREYSQEHRQNKIVLDADDSKLKIQECLRVSPGNPGALTLCYAPQSHHKTVSHHLASEVYRKWKDKDGTMKEEWKQSGANHWLDCAGYAWVAGKILGWKIPNTSQSSKPTDSETNDSSWLYQKAHAV